MGNSFLKILRIPINEFTDHEKIAILIVRQVNLDLKKENSKYRVWFGPSSYEEVIVEGNKLTKKKFDVIMRKAIDAGWFKARRKS